MENLKSRKLSFGKVMLITIFITLFFLLGGYLHSYTFLSAIPYDIEGTGVSVWGNIWKIVWAGLAFLFIKFYNKELPIPISKMLSFKKINFKIIFIVLAVIALVDFSASIVMQTKTPNNFSFLYLVINFFFVGLTEEVVFRGWAMNAFSKVTSIRKANIIQSVFFMFVHLLPWCLALFMRSVTISEIPILSLAIQMIYCIVFGCILGRIFNKTNSLWTTVIIHCLNDVIATFFGLGF